MSSDAYWVQDPNKPIRALVVAEVPLFWHVASKWMWCWPFSIFHRRLSRYYANLMETTPQVHVPITEEQYKEIKTKLWKDSV